ncbi:MAG: metal-dependent transcriptional regulator, partial [Candidatus Helarchaeales archaeon]
EFLNKKEVNGEFKDMLELLKKKGYVQINENGVKLTEKGLELAKKIYQKHELFESFLEYCLDYDKDQAHLESEKIEHQITDEMAQKLEELMVSQKIRIKRSYPRHECRHFKRHGCKRPFFSGLFKNGQFNGRRIIPLTWLKPGEKGRVYEIHGGWRIIQRLSQLGLTKETPISVVRTSPFGGAFEVVVRDSHYVLGHNVASKIMIEVDPDGRKI